MNLHFVRSGQFDRAYLKPPRQTGADASPNMVHVASSIANRLDIERIHFSVRDVLDTQYPDDAFDVVVCNRLLHHCRSPVVRTKVLKELGRVSRGPVIAFHFIRLAH